MSEPPITITDAMKQAAAESLRPYLAPGYDTEAHAIAAAGLALQAGLVAMTAALAVAPLSAGDTLEQTIAECEARGWEWSVVGLNQSAGVLPKCKATVTRQGLKAEPERGRIIVTWTFGRRDDSTYTQTFEHRGDTPLAVLRMALQSMECAAMTAADGREE